MPEATEPETRNGKLSSYSHLNVLNEYGVTKGFGPNEPICWTDFPEPARSDKILSAERRAFLTFAFERPERVWCHQRVLRTNGANMWDGLS